MPLSGKLRALDTRQASFVANVRVWEGRAIQLSFFDLEPEEMVEGIVAQEADARFGSGSRSFWMLDVRRRPLQGL